jgi:hypothetical protein
VANSYPRPPASTRLPSWLQRLALHPFEMPGEGERQRGRQRRQPGHQLGWGDCEMQPSQKRYAWVMRLAVAGFAGFALAACGGLVAPGNGEPSGGPVGSGSTDNATQSGAAVSASAANGGAGPESTGDASGVAVMPSGTPSGASESNGMPGAAGNSGTSGASNGVPGASTNNGDPGSLPNSGAPGATATNGTGNGSMTGGSAGAVIGFGFASSDGGITAGGSCPVSSGPVTCEALPAQIDPTGESAFSGNWPGCQYMVCFDETCLSCTCMASGPQAIWVCGTAPSQGPTLPR